MNVYIYIYMFAYPVMTVTHFIREPVLKRAYLVSRRFVFSISGFY